MQKTQLIQLKEKEQTKILHFSLPTLLPVGHTLALNLDTRTLSLLADGPQLIMEQQFSFNELSVIVPILESFPYYCPYEELLAHISSSSVTQATITRCSQRLEEAQNRGTLQEELRPIRRALSSLRVKLHDFDMGISNVRERGCGLASLHPHSSSRLSA